MDNAIDRREIEDLVQRLAVCLDEGDFAGMRALFTPDATASTPGGTAEGVEAVVAQAARNHTPERPTQHLMSGVLVELAADAAADTAVARANALVSFAGPDARPVLMMGEVYRFRARRTADGWRLASVATAPVWRSGELPAAVA